MLVLRPFACALTGALAACAAVSPPRAAPAPQEPPAPPPVDDESAPQDIDADADLAPQDPTPPELSFDWLRLTSGEWLKGELKVLRDGDLEFESDELGTLTLDWDDVAELRSPRLHTILLEGRETLVGKLHVDGDRVVLTDTASHELPRDELLSIVPGEPSELNYWSGRISLGVTTRKGNTNQTDGSASLEARRDTASTRWWTTYNGALSRAEGVETGNNHRVDSRFDWFLSERLFVTPVGFQAFRDPFQNIALRLTPGAGFGYDIVADGPVEVSIFAGPAYQYIEYVSAELDEARTDSTLAGIAVLNSSWDVTPQVEFGLDYSVTVPVPDAGAYNSRLSALIDVELVWDLDLEVRFVWDRVNDPQADDTGLVPVRDDYRMEVGFGWEF